MTSFARSVSLAFGVVAVASAGLVSASPPTVELAGTSAWGLQDMGSSCRLARGFGEGDAQIAAAIERTGPDIAFSLTLVGEPVASKSNTSVPITIRFEPGGEKESRRAPAGGLGKGRTPYLVFENTTLFGPRPETGPGNLVVDEARERGINGLLIELPGRSYRLKLGPMDGPMTSLRGCTDGIVRSWGLDPRVQATLRTPVAPVGDWRKWFRKGDFPNSLIRARRNVIIRYVLMVDATGEITNCKIPSLAAGDRLAAHTCSLLSHRLRLTPAIDADGEPVPSFYNRSIVLGS